MYRTASELNKNELDELKNGYYWNEENDYDYVDDIPDSVIIDFYSGINFVEEDFFCNIKAR